MPDRSSRPKRPRDLNELAASIVGDAIGEPTMLAPETPAENPAAVEPGVLYFSLT